MWLLCALSRIPIQTSPLPSNVVTIWRSLFIERCKPTQAQVWRRFLGVACSHFSYLLHLWPRYSCSLATCLLLNEWLTSLAPRSAWTFPIGFPENVVDIVVASRTRPWTPPGTPPGTPPMTPGTPPGPPPGVMAPTTPPELLEHLLPPPSPEGAWDVACASSKKNVRAPQPLHRAALSSVYVLAHGTSEVSSGLTN